MFVSRTDEKTTSTIKVNVGQDIFFSLLFFIIGAGLVIVSIPHPINHYVALLIGLLLLLSGFGLGQATLRLMWRGWLTYDGATRKEK